LTALAGCTFDLFGIVKCGQHMANRDPRAVAERSRRRRAQREQLKELAKSYNIGLAAISRLTK
jgi:hypothetical protein